MPIPGYQHLTKPILQELADNKVRTLSELRDELAAVLGITEEERQHLKRSRSLAATDWITFLKLLTLKLVPSNES